MKNWESLQEFFGILNNHVDYLMLRNYENLLDNILNAEHPDIDILCRDIDEVLAVISSRSRTKDKNDKIHREVLINNQWVDIDIRYVGDGYYDSKWEKNMLDTKVKYKNMFYVMEQENYYFSLLYHALVQKYSVSKDYSIRLQGLAKALNIKQALSIDVLQDFMLKNGYYYTYPVFSGGIANFRNVNKKMIKKDYMRIIKRIIYRIRNKLHR